MTGRIYEIPKYWLTLDVCADIFEEFSKSLEFDEPIPPFETRFPGKLESILGSVPQTSNGKLLNPSILEAAASYFNYLIRDHHFLNGNKRLSVLFTHFFLLRHGIEFDLSFGEIYNLAVFVAQAGERGIGGDAARKICSKVIEDFTKDLL